MPSLHSFFCSFIRLFIHSFVCSRSFIHSFIRSFVCSFVRLFVCVRLFAFVFIYYFFAWFCTWNRVRADLVGSSRLKRLAMTGHWTKTGILLCLPTKWLRVAMQETDWIIGMPALAMTGFEHHFDNPVVVVVGWWLVAPWTGHLLPPVSIKHSVLGQSKQRNSRLYCCINSLISLQLDCCSDLIFNVLALCLWWLVCWWCWCDAGPLE
jgi:hypothetical protein